MKLNEIDRLGDPEWHPHPRKRPSVTYKLIHDELRRRGYLTHGGQPTVLSGPGWEVTVVAGMLHCNVTARRGPDVDHRSVVDHVLLNMRETSLQKIVDEVERMVAVAKKKPEHPPS